MKKILIIEDDNTIRSLLTELLTQNGYEATGCMLLQEAAALLNGGSFDLIISDIGLPDGNGLDFCSRYKQIPFIAMSGLECPELAKESGAKAYIEKPFKVADLLAAIASL